MRVPEGFVTMAETLPGASPGFFGTARESTVNSAGDSTNTAANGQQQLFQDLSKGT